MANRRFALIVCLVSALLAAALLALPAFRFETALFSVKSGNTFVGDEKYLAKKAQAEDALETCRESGGYGDVALREEVTERVNSKGEKTSMVAFSVTASRARSGYAFIASGLPSGRVLLALAALGALSLALLLAGCRKSLDTPPRALKAGQRRLRRAACFCALGALILVPAFVMRTTVYFGREIIALLSQADTPAVAARVAAADGFLHGGSAGAEAASLLGGLQYRPTAYVWLLAPVFLCLLLGAVQLSEGELKRPVMRGALYLFVIAVCAVILYPYYVMLITAFRSNAESTDMYFRYLFPTKWLFSNLGDIVRRGVPRYLLNSLALSAGATGVALLCGVPAAYAMSRMRFRGKKAFLGFVIMSQMFAPVVLLVGISRLMNFLRLNDSIVGLMLINAAFNQAFAIWLLRGTFMSISSEMEQAACIDGCSTIGSLLHVLLPMAAPGIVTTLIFVFINAWNEYTISTVLISSAAKKPITVGITQFSSFNMIEWQYLFASALLATIPVVVLFMFIEKHLVAGLTSGGVKG